MRRTVLTFVLMTSCAYVRAQEAPFRTDFERLFPHPTGENGYEELVAAGDLLRTSEILQQVQVADPEATLADKRAALNDPPVKRGLALVRAGLAKPLIPIHERLDSDTIFPEFALFRNEARTLVIEMYVRFADGNVNGAIDSLRDGLRLARACGTDTLIAGLVQVAIDAIGVRPFALRLGQLSARDCDRVLALCREWLASPDPSIAIMEGERRFVMRMWEKCRANPEAFLQRVGEIEGGNEDQPNPTASNYRTRAQDLVSNPAAYRVLIDSIEASTAAQFDAQIANLRRPPWERVILPEARIDSLPGYLSGTLIPALNRIPDRFIQDRATIQLLGLQAAIRRYLWENDRLPDRLEDLRVRDLAVDPFSGKLFAYRRAGPRDYELSSVGPLKTDDNGRPTPGTRVPLYLPPRPK